MPPLFVVEPADELGGRGGGLAVLTKAQTALPEDLEIMDRRRSIHFKQGRFQEVLVSSEEQLKIRPDHLPGHQGPRFVPDVLWEGSSRPSRPWSGG